MYIIDGRIRFMTRTNGTISSVLSKEIAHFLSNDIYEDKMFYDMLVGHER